MNIKDMRCGGFYVYHGRLIVCCALAEEVAGGTMPMAAYRSHDDCFLWGACRDFRAATRADIANDIQARYAQ